MEEQKIKTKEVKMSPLKKGLDAPKASGKLSYEELNQACMDMSQQLQNQTAYIQQLQRQLQHQDAVFQIKRMEFLFKVVELSNVPASTARFSQEFLVSCIDEIQEMLTIPKEESKEDSSKEG